MRKNHGTTHEAIAFANTQIQQYQMGDYIKVRKHDGGDEPTVESIYQITRIEEGDCSFFSTTPPAFCVKDIKGGPEENIIRFKAEYKLRGTWHHASVFPFAFYNGLTHQYQRNPHGGSGFYRIEKLDNVAVKDALTHAICEKKRRQEYLQKKKMEEYDKAVKRRKENDSISQNELSELLDELRRT